MLPNSGTDFTKLLDSVNLKSPWITKMLFTTINCAGFAPKQHSWECIVKLSELHILEGTEKGHSTLKSTKVGNESTKKDSLR